jgi:hypothetical protein
MALGIGYGLPFVAQHGTNPYKTQWAAALEGAKGAGASVEDENAGTGSCLVSRGQDVYTDGLPSTPSLLIVPQFYKDGNLYQDVPPFVAEDTTMRFTVSRNTTATRVNSSGLIASVASGVPRIDWLGQSCPALLVEASGTNVALRSAGIDVSGTWQRTNISAVTSGITSPEGTATAFEVVESSDATAQTHELAQTGFSVVSGTTYTYSLFIKAGTNNRNLRLAFGGANFVGSPVAFFSPASGTVVSNTDCTASIESYGNGWFRCRMTATADVAGSSFFGIYTASGTSVSYIGNGNGSVQVWGAQVETGAIPTSYIPTTTGAVSRAADVISASGALVSGLIGQTEGTMYCEFEATNNSSTRRIFTISDNTTSNRIMLIYNAGEYRAQINSTSVSLGNFTSGFHKIAFAYQQDGVSGNLFASIDGGAVVSGTSATFPTGLSFTTIGKHESSLSTESFNARIRAAALYTTRLSNDQLAELTRL